MFSECDEVAENIFNSLNTSQQVFLHHNKPRIRTLVIERMQDESETVISSVTESLTNLIANASAA